MAILVMGSAVALNVHAADLEKLKSTAVEMRLGARAKVVLQNRGKITGFLERVDDQGVTLDSREIRYDEMKSLREKRPRQWLRNGMAAFGIFIYVFTIVVG